MNVGLALTAFAWLTVGETVATQDARSLIVDTCMPGPWLVFFHSGTAEPESDPRLSQIVDAMKRNDPGCQGSVIRIDGHGAPGEPAAIALERALVVYRMMVAEGFPVERVFVRSLAAIDTPPAWSTAARKGNRARVEINWVQNPGW